MAKASVKSVCEEAILKGTKKGILMNSLRKNFEKDDATYEKSIKYYASALFREGKIDEEAKNSYCGKPNQKSSSAVAKGSAKASRTERKKSKSEAGDNTSVKKSGKKRGIKASKASKEETPNVEKPVKEKRVKKLKAQP
jgi:hypothetical protein